MKRVVILLQQQNNNKKKDNYSINNMNNEQNHYLLCRIAELWLKLDKKKTIESRVPVFAREMDDWRLQISSV